MLHQHTLAEVFVTQFTNLSLCSRLLPAGCGPCGSPSATGDARISRPSPGYRGAGGDTLLLADQITTPFPSRLFGHNDTGQVFP